MKLDLGRSSHRTLLHRHHQLSGHDHLLEPLPSLLDQSRSSLFRPLLFHCRKQMVLILNRQSFQQSKLLLVMKASQKLAHYQLPTTSCCDLGDPKLLQQFWPQLDCSTPRLQFHCRQLGYQVLTQVLQLLLLHHKRQAPFLAAVPASNLNHMINEEFLLLPH